MTVRPNLRFRERGFEVRIWRANACRRATLPVPVFLKRLDAPLCVFSLGMIYCPGLYYSGNSRWAEARLGGTTHPLSGMTHQSVAHHGHVDAARGNYTSLTKETANPC